MEIGPERHQVGNFASQFNRPSPVFYLCSVEIARPAPAFSSYKRNPTGSGNRRQMATPSESNLTVQWVDFDLLLRKYSSSSTCFLRVTSTLQVAKSDRKRESVVRSIT
jgi:hypothetical protein